MALPSEAEDSTGWRRVAQVRDGQNRFSRSGRVLDADDGAPAARMTRDLDGERAAATPDRVRWLTAPREAGPGKPPVSDGDGRPLMLSSVLEGRSRPESPIVRPFFLASLMLGACGSSPPDPGPAPVVC